MNIYDEIEQHWRAVYADMHCKPSFRGGFDKLLLEIEAETHSKTADGLQPKLAIFEFGLEWLSYVHIALSSNEGPGPKNDDARASWALIGSAVSFGLSIRRLSLSGFDTPAKALLRTFVEVLFLCIAVLHDRSLGKATSLPKTIPKSRTFGTRLRPPRSC